MKKFMSVFAVVCLTNFLFFASQSSAVAEKQPKGDISFTIKNDTGTSFRVYDEKGYYTINNSSTKQVTVEEGRKFYNGDGGKKGKLLFEANPSMEGKVIKLSDYL